jgi:glutathione S-transferase
MIELYDDMEAQLVEHPWLVGAKYTIADAAFTPYVVRLEHLDILGLLSGHPKVLDWFNRLKTRPSFQDAIVKWENPNYLALMKLQGRENWDKIRQIVAG